MGENLLQIVLDGFITDQ